MIVLYPDPRLGQAALHRPVDDGLRAIGERLRAAATAANAFGLAAVHIGAVAPVVVVSIHPDPTRRDYRLLYNPTIDAVATETSAGTEGSVSMPGVEAEIVRPVWADVSWDDETGSRQGRRFDGLAARVAQHEIDQVNGLFFLSRLSRLKRDIVLKRWRKLRSAA